MDIENITEHDALSIVQQLKRKFGWPLVIYTRDDVHYAIQERHGDYNTEPNDELIDKVMGTRMWNKYMEEAMLSTGWECLSDAVYEVEDDDVEDDDESDEE